MTMTEHPPAPEPAPPVPEGGWQTFHTETVCDQCSGVLADKPCRWPGGCRRGWGGVQAWQCRGSRPMCCFHSKRIGA